ncbi:MAG TPA: hypothetical protein VKF35_02970 [Hyphomicrobiaceae bacterium]|nr:hypothetical protein [Hyphomicrobiaceae bacterium]
MTVAVVTRLGGWAMVDLGFDGLITSPTVLNQSMLAWSRPARAAIDAQPRLGARALL